MRRVVVFAVFLAACGKVNTFTDAGAIDASVIDGKASTIDAINCADLQTCGDSDGCCPASCNANNDPDCSPTCGNGVIESGETCDPLNTCPTDCPAIGCTLQTLQGQNTCHAACATSGQISQCVSGDNCCPGNCNLTNDTDCAATCGNGVVEPGELCDGNCPTSCPQQGCQLYSFVDGGPCQEQCVAAGTQGACQSNDGCCPAGCNATNDNDCVPSCGNGVVEPGETCDGNCPASCSAPWTYGWTQTGSAATCNLQCDVAQQTCASADNICTFIGGTGGTDCNINDDRECHGQRWQYMEITWAPQTWAINTTNTVGIYGLAAGDSVLVTTCTPDGSLNTTDTYIYSVKDLTGAQLIANADDSWWGPSPPFYGTAQVSQTLPVLAGWNCAVNGGSLYLSTAPIAPGGMTINTTGLTVQYGGYNMAAGSAKLFLWWSGASTPHPG